MFAAIPTLLLTLGPIMVFFLVHIVPTIRPKKSKNSSRNPRNSKTALLRTVQSMNDIPSQADIVAFLNLNVPTTHADLEAVRMFLQAAAAMKDVPEYRNRMLKRMERKHCVRCHGEYSEATNVKNACKISHAFSDEMSFFGKKASFDDEIYTHEALCCKGVELDTIDGESYINLSGVGFCFEGKHTTQEMTVEFGGGTNYNGLNILECVNDPETGRCLLPVAFENPMVFTTES